MKLIISSLITTIFIGSLVSCSPNTPDLSLTQTNLTQNNPNLTNPNQQLPNQQFSNLNPTSQRQQKIILSFASINDLKVREGDTIAEGEVLSDRSQIRQEIQSKKQEILAELQRTSLPVPPLPPLPPPNLILEQAAVNQAKAELELAQNAPPPNFRFIDPTLQQIHEPELLERQALQEQEKVRKAIAYQTAVAGLQAAQQNYQYLQIQHQYKQQEYEIAKQRQQYEISYLRSQLQNLELASQQLVAIRSPFSGTVRRIKFLDQNDRELKAEITLAVTTQQVAFSPNQQQLNNSLNNSLNSGNNTLNSPNTSLNQQNRANTSQNRTATNLAANPPPECPQHLSNGIPQGTPTTNKLIVRDIYCLSNNKTTKFADWVAYSLTPSDLNGSPQQERDWQPDPDLKPSETLFPNDYRGAHRALGVDRGHQAPLANFRNRNWQQTNYLSNITPQSAVLNRGAWKDLEDYERTLANQYGQIYVITGTAYERPMKPLPNASKSHQVPSGYWKIISVNGQSEAYFFDQSTPANTDFRSGLTTIETIEQKTGFTFFN
jgi:endonuclease G, mitochondrial